MPTTKGKPASRPYTEEDRRRLLAPFAIRSFGGKSWGGASPRSYDLAQRQQTGDRYGYAADHRDLDSL
jgi:hypothetical protein